MRSKKKLLVISALVTSFLFLVACGNRNKQDIAACDTDSNQHGVEPDIPVHSIFRPIIELKDETASAGTAFSVEFGEDKIPLILSAIHLLGPHGGLSKDVPSLQIPDLLKRLSLADAFDSEPCGTVTKALSIPGAKPSSLKKDVMVFLPDKDLNIARLKISDKMPKPGEFVWLAASVNLGAPKDQKLHKATVVSSSASKLSYRYDVNSLGLQGTSGAPIINKDGEVVGINISKETKGKDLIGLANPCESFKKMITDALEK